MATVKAPKVGTDCVSFCVGNSRLVFPITRVVGVDPETGIWTVETSNPGRVVRPNAKHGRLRSADFLDFLPDHVEWHVKENKYRTDEWEIATDLTPFTA